MPLRRQPRGERTFKRCLPIQETAFTSNGGPTRLDLEAQMSSHASPPAVSNQFASADFPVAPSILTDGEGGGRSPHWSMMLGCAVAPRDIGDGNAITPSRLIRFTSTVKYDNAALGPPVPLSCPPRLLETTPFNS